MSSKEDSAQILTKEDMALLLQSFKSTVDEVKGFSQEKGEEARMLVKSVQDVHTCVSKIKIRIERMDTEQNGFMQARRDRTYNCDKKHADFESRLREAPAESRCDTNEHRLEVIETKIDKFVPLLYKLIGGVVILSLILPPLFTSLFGVAIAYFKSHGTHP